MSSRTNEHLNCSLNKLGFNSTEIQSLFKVSKVYLSHMCMYMSIKSTQIQMKYDSKCDSNDLKFTQNTTQRHHTHESTAISRLTFCVPGYLWIFIFADFPVINSLIQVLSVKIIKVQPNKWNLTFILTPQHHTTQSVCMSSPCW